MPVLQLSVPAIARLRIFFTNPYTAGVERVAAMPSCAVCASSLAAVHSALGAVSAVCSLQKWYKGAGNYKQKKVTLDICHLAMRGLYVPRQ